MGIIVWVTITLEVVVKIKMHHVMTILNSYLKQILYSEDRVTLLMSPCLKFI